MEYLKTAAIFMICLILTLPFYSASVFAQTEGLTNVKVEGKVEGADGYTGFARSEDDTFTFSARACVNPGDAPGVDVEPSQVKLWGYSSSTGFSFSECAYVGDGCSYDCSFQRIMSDYNFCPHYYFDINLYDKSGNFKDDQDAEVTCDMLSPSLSVSKDASIVNSDGTIKFTYSITDEAYPSSGSCVGIQNIVFSVGGSVISGGDVSINTDPNVCSYTNDLEKTGSSFGEGDITLTVAAYDNFDQESNTETLTFTTDFTEPNIVLDSFDITDLSGNEITYFTPQTVKATLVVNITDINLDTATIEEDFSNIDLTSAPSESYTSIANGRQYTYSNMQFYLDSASFQSKIIKINASDTAGNKNEKQLTLSHESFGQDSTAPVINGLRITHRTPIEAINWTKNATTYDAYVYVNITETEIGLDEITVVADLHKLNPFESSYKRKQKTSCSSLNVNITECVWEVVINLNKSSTFTASLVFNASDIVGNKQPTTLPYEFKIDGVPPVFTSIGTLNINSSGHSFVKSTGNTFIAEIEEAGVGLKKENVFIDLSKLNSGTGYDKKPSDNCTSSGSTWTCYWYNVDTAESDGVYEVSSHADTEDNTGNKWDETLIVNVTVDTTKPVVNSITIVPEFSSGGPPAIENYIQVGNALSITINLTEANQLSATGNFSSIITEAGGIQEGDCIKPEGYWICTWSTSAIDVVDEYTETTINFNFTDAAGNIGNHSESITVYAYNETIINYWDGSVGESSPFAIDKELVVHYDPYVYFPVEINPRLIGGEEPEPKELWPVSVDLGECTGDNTQHISSDKDSIEVFDYNSALLSSSSLFPYNVYFKFTMEQSEPDTNNLSINCTLKIKTLIDNESISPEETVNLTFSILYYNNPLGTMDSRISDEIDRVKDSWLVKAEWLDDIKELLNYAKMICRVFKIFYGVAEILNKGKDVLSTCCLVPWSSAVCCPAARGIGETQAPFKDSFEAFWGGIGNFFCKITGCQLFYLLGKKDGNWLQKYLNFLKETYGSKQGYFGNVDPQHSLILSIIMLCPDGIIYNLQKARVIDCMYINCLKQTKYGMPLYSCTYQRAYAYCKFVYGEIFNLIPFAAVISQLGQNVLKALSHPYEAIGAIVKVGCRYLICKDEKTPGCTLCSRIALADWIFDVMCDLGLGAGHCQPIWDTLTVDDSVCEEALED